MKLFLTGATGRVGTRMLPRLFAQGHQIRSVARRVTKSLLGWGVVAGPLYLAVGVAQALTRDGFDITRHPMSLLSNGALGWIQIANFVVSGLALLAFAVGLRRRLHPGRGGAWGPRLIGAYGAGLVAAGIFVADPMNGFPAGTPTGPVTVSWHGMLHYVAGAVGFTGLIAACFVLARRFAADGQPGWAAYSVATGVVFLAGYAGVASGSQQPAVFLAFTVAVGIAWAWITAVAAHLLRQTA
jgi:hypothetical protein